MSNTAGMLELGREVNDIVSVVELKDINNAEDHWSYGGVGYWTFADGTARNRLAVFIGVETESNEVSRAIKRAGLVERAS